MEERSELAELKWRVWEQSWVHSRHLETMRGQYLGFFFTVILGVAVLVPQTVISDGLATPSSLLTLSVLAMGLNLLAAYLLLVVTRIGDVLCHYGEILKEIQIESRARDPSPVAPAWLRLPTEDRRVTLHSRLRSTQWVTELILVAATLAFAAGLVAAAVWAASVSTTPAATTAVCMGALVIGLLVTGGSLWALGRPSIRAYPLAGEAGEQPSDRVVGGTSDGGHAPAVAHGGPGTADE